MRAMVFSLLALALLALASQPVTVLAAEDSESSTVQVPDDGLTRIEREVRGVFKDEKGQWAINDKYGIKWHVLEEKGEGGRIFWINPKVFSISYTDPRDRAEDPRNIMPNIANGEVKRNHADGRWYVRTKNGDKWFVHKDMEHGTGKYFFISAETEEAVWDDPRGANGENMADKDEWKDDPDEYRQVDPNDPAEKAKSIFGSADDDSEPTKAKAKGDDSVEAMAEEAELAKGEEADAETEAEAAHDEL